MRALVREEGGSLAVLTVVLLPLTLVVLAGVLELGLVRVVAERGRIAADLATVTAVNDQDETELARSGSIRTALDADAVARAQLAVGLEPLQGMLAATPGSIAESADVAVFREAGATDPRTGRTYSGPTVRIAAELPVLTPAFAVLLAKPVTVVHLFSASSAR